MIVETSQTLWVISACLRILSVMLYLSGFISLYLLFDSLKVVRCDDLLCLLCPLRLVNLRNEAGEPFDLEGYAEGADGEGHCACSFSHSCTAVS